MAPPKTWQWERTINAEAYLVSTSQELLPHEFVQEAFDTPSMSWAHRTSPENMKTMLDNSCVVALYKVDSATSTTVQHTPLGMARMITDYSTFAYLTDVYLAEESRGSGLGRWLIHCCRDIVRELPDLRWLLLLTGSPAAQRMYEKDFGMEVLGVRDNGLVALGARRSILTGQRRHPWRLYQLQT